MPKAVEKDSMEEIMRKKKNVDFSVYENGKNKNILSNPWHSLIDLQLNFPILYLA